ncbi:AAA domain-containing protein [Fusarium sp. Ph1]|nr:AAA domain-containing protein [Fusarium sp. Ph1]
MDNLENEHLIRYKVKYIGKGGGDVILDKNPDFVYDAEEPPIFEHIDVRLSSLSTISDKVDYSTLAKTEVASGHCYINIFSPVVAEALRCVVDYFPGVYLSESVIRVPEPYNIFVFFEKELTEYRERLEKAAETDPLTCTNRFASKHIAIVQDFVKKRIQAQVDAERERHARGYASFDMLWLLYKPGADMYFDRWNINEHEPFVMTGVEFTFINDAADFYKVRLWNMDADFDRVGPAPWEFKVDRFPGERKIVDLPAFPCEYLHFSEDVESESIPAIKKHLVNRGKKWYSLRREVRPYHFDGFTTTFPRKSFNDLAIVDSRPFPRHPEDRKILIDSIAHPSSPLKICSCEKCEERIYRHAVKPKFVGYSNINPQSVETLTEHQYFLCDSIVEAFLFKAKSWRYLHVDGFQEASFDGPLFDDLVLKDSSKMYIQDLAKPYIRGIQENKPQKQLRSGLGQIHKPSKQKQPWSPEATTIKGDGLTMLLHGRPGVGKSYTAECIAQYTRRPLLSLDTSDLGPRPDRKDESLVRWFKLAEKWGAIVLIDDAEVFLDFGRTDLVANFLRASSYFKGILILTTNRLKAFDHVLMSHVNAQILYPHFDDEERTKLWGHFFQKLEADADVNMSVMEEVKDYVKSEEIQALEWNGREIQSAFQVAVKLAEAKGEKNDQGRILVTVDNLKPTVQNAIGLREYILSERRRDWRPQRPLREHSYDAVEREEVRSQPEH